MKARHLRTRATCTALRSAWALFALASLAAFASPPARADEPAAPAPGAPQEPPAAEEPRRAVYLPETARDQIIEQIRKEVMDQAKAEGWAWSNLVPPWLQKVRLGGDVRVRFERILYPRGNANAGEFPDFNAINNGSPFDRKFVDYANERYLDVDRNRTRLRLRARLGLDTDVGSGVSIKLRVGSGDSASPVSTNQTWGTPGDFSKTPLWLDRGAIEWDAFYDENLAKVAASLVEEHHLFLTAGRMENPFHSTELLFDKNVNFDGVAVRGDWLFVDPYLRLFWAGGVFPLKLTAINFPAEQPAKFPGHNQFLYALQAGAESKIEMFKLKLGLSFYDFDGIEGRTSAPCDTNLKGLSCSTDDLRPGFAQVGNTYMPLRTPSDTALALEGAGGSQYQYFGLSSRFRVLDAYLRAEVKLHDLVKATLEGDYAHNATFKRSSLQSPDAALNNRGPATQDNPVGTFDGGGDAGLLRVTIGSPTQNRPLDWRFTVSYRYVESDAVLDALVDGDFGLGGTNFKGYGLEAAFTPILDVTVLLRWFSAGNIAGPRYDVDNLQLDLQARF
jgi:Putative porin